MFDSFSVNYKSNLRDILKTLCLNTQLEILKYKKAIMKLYLGLQKMQSDRRLDIFRLKGILLAT